MAQVLRLMLEDREAAHAEHQANLATLQHLAQLATNNNNNVVGMTSGASQGPRYLPAGVLGISTVLR
jgi:hypothetical protein